MQRLTLLGPTNGGRQDRIDALFRIYPWLKKICGNQSISVLSVFNATDIVSHPHSISGMGFNTAGQIYFVRGGRIVNTISWDKVRQHRKELGLPEPYQNSPQAELSGDEEVCVSVEEHHAEDDFNKKWVSIEVFMCCAGNRFGDLPEVRAWIAEVELRKELQSAGLVSR